MENIENNMSGLDNLKQQYDLLKEQFDQQQIINDRLMKSAIQSKNQYFRNYRKKMIISYPIACVFAIWFLWHLYGSVMLWPCIILGIMMVIGFIVELHITRHLGNTQVENKDLLTLSQQATQAGKKYLIYNVAFSIAFFGLLIFTPINTLYSLPKLLLAVGIVVILNIIICVNFNRRCNDLVKQINDNLGEEN